MTQTQSSNPPEWDPPRLPEFRKFKVRCSDPERFVAHHEIFAHTVNLLNNSCRPTAVFACAVGFTEDGGVITLVSRVLADVLDLEDLGAVENSGIVQ